MKKALSLIVMMSCIAVFCSCRSTAQKQPAGASQERYFLGTYSAVFPCSLRMMDKAVRETCAKSKLIEVYRANSITTCTYLYKDVNNIPLKIELEERKDDTVKIKMKIGSTGDKESCQLILIELDSNLRTQGAQF